MTDVTLVTGGNAAQREASIAAFISPHTPTALILEGIAPGVSHLASESENLRIIRIAPGCMCCVGNLTLRVTLNRLLRKPPSHLYISLSNSSHLAQIQAFLSEAPYDALLTLSTTVNCDENTTPARHPGN